MLGVPNTDDALLEVGGREAWLRPALREGASFMAIYRLLQNAAFEPAAIQVMTAAYEDACRVLRLADRTDPLTELVAKKIIEIAQTGERDPIRLRQRALGDLGVSADE
jgi:hypothetical protein